MAAIRDGWSDLGPDRRLKQVSIGGLRALSPPVFRPKSTRNKEVILVWSVYAPVQPGTGKRSLERLLESRTANIQSLFAPYPAIVLGCDSKTPPEMSAGGVSFMRTTTERCLPST